jgi:GNS1/SUR4 family
VTMPLITVSLYVFFVKWFGPRVLQPHLKLLELRPILVVWNLFMSVLSAVMLYGMAVRTFPRLWMHGAYGVVCDPGRELYLGTSLFWAWVFTMSKYAELLDTVLLILRHRTVTLLHWYHHASVLTFCWFQMLIKAGSVGYVFAIMNCAVHTLMYFYYFLTSLRFRPTWDATSRSCSSHRWWSASPSRSSGPSITTPATPVPARISRPSSSHPSSSTAPTLCLPVLLPAALGQWSAVQGHQRQVQVQEEQVQED